MTPMRTSSLRHDPNKPPRTLSKENLHPLNSSPRKPLKEVGNSLQPADLVREDTEEFIEHSKRILRNLQVENTSLKQKIEELEASNEMARSRSESLDTVQSEMEKLVKENHRLEAEIQQLKSQQIMSPARPKTASEEIVRLSEELAWHAKLHLYAEKERMRLLDLLDFAGKEGRIVGREFRGLQERFSKMSLRSEFSADGVKCLV